MKARHSNAFMSHTRAKTKKQAQNYFNQQNRFFKKDALSAVCDKPVTKSDNLVIDAIENNR